jgi:CubicO group peptidase (beta-lactamase class C family)
MRTILVLSAFCCLAFAQTPTSPVDGVWLGTLRAGPQTLRIQITVKTDASGHPAVTLQSLDQGGVGMPCANVVFAAPDFSFEVPVVQGKWSGKLEADGKTLTGSWTQGGFALTLNMTRQAAAIGPAPVANDPALPPVGAANLQAVLDRDLAKSLASGELAPATGTGVAIGVVQGGVRRIFTYGAAKPDAIFEIGSITKTFTGLILAEMVIEGKVKYNDPVRELLPAGTVAKPAGAEITLLDLATQHSGLPRMPDNFHPADPSNPYADYRPADLYAFIAKHGVEKPDDPPYGYSNLGVGLLGQALAERAGVPYPELLKQKVAGPLGLKDTVIALSSEQQGRFIQGHDADHHPVHAWDLDALAGAGAIRSTAPDMLTYLEAQLHPDAKLAAAVQQSHELRNDVGGGMRIALAWMYKPDDGDYWHNGATGGYSSFASFNPKTDCALVVLTNISIGSKGSLADALGGHIVARLEGKPALSLE